MQRKVVSLIALALMLPLVVSGSSAVEVAPSTEVKTELVGKYMLTVGDFSSVLPITVETAEAKVEGVTLDKVLMAADAARMSAIPSKLFLDQNYPNPFNPSTMIRYGLPNQSNVRLTVHTLLGTQVKVVFETFQDPGIYTFDFAAQDLPSGMYFYRLQTDMGTLTRRMTISK